MIYSNPRMEAVIADWPTTGSQRTTATFRIEVTKRGERGTRFTLDRHGVPTATKVLTYAPKARIVDGDDGRTYIIELTVYGFVSVMRGDMKYQHESIFKDDPRHADLIKLFDETIRGD